MVPHTTDTWLGFHLSFDGGTTWFGAPPFPNGFNTMVPGFVTDTSPAGQASPLLGLDGAGDPIVRFDRQGNLLVGGIAFNRQRDPGERPLDTVGFVAKYNFTPGTPATASTPNSAGSPPHFTYAGTAIVDRGAIGFAVPSGFAGNFTDKPWMEVDLNAPSASPCSGYVYYADTNFHGQQGSSPIVFSRSTDGGTTWSSPRDDLNGRAGRSPVQPGRRHRGRSQRHRVRRVRSLQRAGRGHDQLRQVDQLRAALDATGGGRHHRVAAGARRRLPDADVRVPRDRLDELQRRLRRVPEHRRGRLRHLRPALDERRNDLERSGAGEHRRRTARHQIFPTIEVSNHALHVAWYDFRNSVTPTNEALDIYYSCTGATVSPGRASTHPSA